MRKSAATALRIRRNFNLIIPDVLICQYHGAKFGVRECARGNGDHPWRAFQTVEPQTGQKMKVRALPQSPARIHATIPL